MLRPRDSNPSLHNSRRKVRTIQMQNLRSRRSRDKAHAKAQKAMEVSKVKTNWSLRKGGAYTADARAMARALVGAGCSQEKVGKMIQYVASMAGRSVKHKMSRQTVQRALMEGGVAARIQLAHEMANADGVALSTDATTMRIFSMTSTVSHSSETQLANIKFQISAISRLYKQSPLARRSKLNFELHDFARIVKTMNADHAADAKKLARLFKEWRNETSWILLGYEEIQRMEPPKIVKIVREIAATNLQEVGGADTWSKLSDDAKDTLTKSSMDTLAHCIGDEVFSNLPPEVKREIELFFWVGCSMHKELNCCVAFEKGMQLYYEGRPESERPVLLANRDNDATIQLAEEGGESTAAVRRALKVSERGAIKLISLFGALVNHKDDKKGLHDIYENYFRPTIGAGVRFPDTSNTRYQSHGCGGARLLSYLEEHCTFMNFVKDQKSKRTLNHMEQNIVKGLHCSRTMAQMIAFVLLCMALNMLDLGPLHDSVKIHMQKLIENPSILVSSSPDAHKLATLDEKPWSNQEAWAACVRLAPTHPDVVPLISAGLKEALDCFERFTEEFAVGGRIDTTTPEERLAGCASSTNDPNKGLLGMWRKFSRESPSSTVGHFTDQAMFRRNDTQTFMDKVMNTDEDHQFLRQEARRIDESSAEKARQAELNAHKQQVVDERREKDVEKAEKARKETERLTAIGIKLDCAEVEKMTDPKLKDQLELHCRRRDKEIPMKSHMKNKGERLAALLAAIGRLEGTFSVASSS
ncbi:hypothetical protein MSAN_01741400 [Mycena sanguinolenta]|uniref:Uncharacterized protein n=1 Tax=Mycena sanguinolenta TaxID=230812 RepID=A0A8H7CTC4_9AGAR|nr:hypothetical protein MSAN_01741400 [Mycena sanguinolenta]